MLIEHYRCYTMYVTGTQSVRVSETILWGHKYLTMPAIMASDAILSTADDLCMSLVGKLPKNWATSNAV